MKKIKFTRNEKMQTIYFELPNIFGCRFICTTEGDPFTDENACDAATDAAVAEVESIISDSAEIAEEADETDTEYVLGLADAWGLL